MSSIYDWSTVAANNSNADGSINWAEGQPPSSVNNSARAMMSRIAELVDDIGGSVAVGGSANVITVLANSPFTDYSTGMILAFKATLSNTGSATLNVNSVGAKAIRKMSQTGEVALAASDIRAGGAYLLRYDTAANSGSGAWMLLTPTQLDVTTISALTWVFSEIVTTTGNEFRVNGAAGVNRGLRIMTGGVSRWLVMANSVAETGSEIGSDFVINAYDDAGGSIGSALTITRAAAGPVSLASNRALRMGTAEIVNAARHPVLRSYTVATLPSATVAGQLIYVSNGTANKRLAVSDGTNWRWPDGAIVS